MTSPIASSGASRRPAGSLWWSLWLSRCSSHSRVAYALRHGNVATSGQPNGPASVRLPPSCPPAGPGVRVRPNAPQASAPRPRRSAQGARRRVLADSRSSRQADPATGGKGAGGRGPRRASAGYVVSRRSSGGSDVRPSGYSSSRASSESRLAMAVRQRCLPRVKPPQARAEVARPERRAQVDGRGSRPNRRAPAGRPPGSMDQRGTRPTVAPGSTH
jgi:hypothetical protein